MVENKTTPEQEVVKSHWYAVTVRTAHLGARTEDTHINYVFARDSSAALIKVRRMRGWKKGYLPTIEPLDDEHSATLEQICRELGINSHDAKRGGVYGKIAFRQNRRPNQTGIDLRDILEERVMQNRTTHHQ